ncbi:MAG: serine/threonine protein kinase [Rhodothermales bacterium]|nr:serine/threonine protein kinase [Rhodothermales bacterium]MBO6781005.1 serine/threonine protein kinase [Rhodothermales bacterium]
MKPGDLVKGKYELLELVGKGGMGLVFRVRCLEGADTLPEGLAPGDECALKVVHQHLLVEDDFVKRFAREARNSLKIQGHPGIVSVYEYDQTDDGSPYLVMEFVRGRTLAEVLEAHPKGVDLQTGYRIVRGLAFALAHMHGAKNDRGAPAPVVHRDLKPGNVVLTDEGEVKLLDFGIAKSDGTKLSRTGLVVGTPAYMSPEQWRGEVLDGRSDQYALGLLAFALLTGEVAFQSETATGYMHQHLSGPIPDARRRRRGITRKASKAITRALAKKRDSRYPSCSAFALEFPAERAPRSKPRPAVAPEASPKSPVPKTVVSGGQADAGSPGRVPGWISVPAGLLAVLVVTLGIVYYGSWAGEATVEAPPPVSPDIQSATLTPPPPAMGALALQADTPVRVIISDSLTVGVSPGSSARSNLRPGSYRIRIQSTRQRSVSVVQVVNVEAGVLQTLDIRLAGQVEAARQNARLASAWSSFSEGARATAQSTTTSTPVSLLLWDNFAEDSGTWEFAAGGTLQEGRLVLEADRAAAYVPTGITHRNFAIRFTLAHLGGTASGGAGVSFGFRQWGRDQHFVLLDAYERRAVRIGTIADTWISALPWTSSPVITRDVNVVELIVSRGEAEVLVNGRSIGRASLPSATAGSVVALMVGGGPATYAFDDVVAVGLGDG